ncbi:peritrophin-48-like [Nylanderia fulva]|uniref:peritrophin-48-like n=1 Tax=Nylanderia fulva TaxID=613905 RepID=UPI0010FB073F|nr:peritrophin-48-like [Nylanderia fulva]
MKGLYLIAIAFLVQTVIAVNEINETITVAADACPAKDTCPPKLIVATDCAQYYECSKGKKVLKDCEDGLYFSKKWQGCVEPEESECDDDNDSGSDGDGDDDDECDDEALYPHECQCNKFYECKNNKRVLRECKSGQHFDEDKERCVPGDCDGSGSSESECEDDGDYLPHECQCNKYYECKNSKKALRECKKGYYFDTKSLKCKKGSCPEAEATCTKGKKKSHECLCEKYYTCTNKEWVVEVCKKNQHFSPTLLKCTTKKAARCEEKTTTEEPTTTPKSEEPGVCPKDVPTRWPHECDCRLYYECKKKEMILQSCAWGRYFDHINQVCEKASKVSSKCKNSWDDWV